MTGLRYVIETFQDPPLYAGADNKWHSDINKSARFISEEAAQALASTLSAECQVTEHMWLRGIKLIY